MIHSLRIKLILAVVLVSVVIFSAIAASVIIQQKIVLEQEFTKQANILAQSLNASIGSEEALSDQNRLQNSIYKLIWLNPDVAQININTIRDRNLVIAASNDTTAIGQTPGENNIAVMKTGKTITKKTSFKGNQVLSITSPIFLAGKTVGTYEIALSLKDLNQKMSTTYFQLVFIMIAGIMALILAMILLLNYLIIKPIDLLNRAVKSFGAEDLGYRIRIASKDEIGELTQAFNQMGENLEQNYTKLQQLNEQLKEAYQEAEGKVKQRTWELEEAKTSLEKKVQERTKELQDLKDNLEKQVKERTAELRENIEELEKIQKITTGRELRMVELKEQIKKMKKRLEKAE